MTPPPTRARPLLRAAVRTLGPPEQLSPSVPMHCAGRANQPHTIGAEGMSASDWQGDCGDTEAALSSGYDHGYILKPGDRHTVTKSLCLHCSTVRHAPCSTVCNLETHSEQAIDQDTEGDSACT